MALLHRQWKQHQTFQTRLHFPSAVRSDWQLLGHLPGLFGYEFLLFLVGCQLSFELLLDRTNVIHMGKQKIEIFHYLVPSVLLISTLRHCIEYEGRLRGRLRGSRCCQLPL